MPLLTEIPEACYQPREHSGPILVCGEHQRKMIFRKPSGRLAAKIKIDDCVVEQNTACDYLVYDWKDRYHFVELKGGHVEEAFKQLAETIPRFIRRGSDTLFWCFVVCTSAPPNSSTAKQAAIKRLRSGWRNLQLTVQTNQCTHELTE